MHQIMDGSCHCSLLRKGARRLTALYDEALSTFGLSAAQFSLLQAIRRQGEVSLTELGRSVGLDRSTVGRNVRVLERPGLVEMRRGKHDRREARVVLTRRGSDLLKEAMHAWAQGQRTLEERMGPVRLKELSRILARL